jgi:hypothetical protein
MAEATEIRAAILLVTPEALRTLLQLPPGTYVDSVNVPHNEPGRFEVRIRGAGWLTPLGGIIPYTTGRISMQHTDQPVPVINWGLPHG